jgi:putative transposase
MQLTSQILLDPTNEQADALKRTLRLTNSCCDYMSKRAFELKVFGRFSLQKLIYREIRDTFTTLTAQVVIRALAKVCDAYSLEHKKQRTFKPLGAISYDSRILSFKVSEKMVNIWSVDGRLKMPFKCGKRQLELLNGKRGEADLCFVNGRFYLFVACEVETPKPIDVDGVLGVDLGIVNIAADSDGGGFSGTSIEDNRRQFAHRRRNLQRNGSKSAKRKLKKISGKQARFQTITNHVISKAIVKIAQDTRRAIGLEDLIGIREAKVRRKQRAKHANWSFFQLRSFIAYKAERAGIPVIFVDPAYTSQTCNECGCVDKANRKSQSLFLCVQCGFSTAADTNASLNIRDRAIVNLPMVSSLRA